MWIFDVGVRLNKMTKQSTSPVQRSGATVLIILLLALAGCTEDREAPTPEASRLGSAPVSVPRTEIAAYAGSDSCRDCHNLEHGAWLQSNHA